MDGNDGRAVHSVTLRLPRTRRPVYRADVRRLILAPLALSVLACALGGCQPRASSVQAGCSAEFSSYLDMWACTRAKVAPRVAGDAAADLGLRYLATGDALAERVKAKQISDADAKLALAQEVSSASSESRRRAALSAASDPVSCTKFGSTVTCY